MGRAELQVGFSDIDEIPGSPSEFGRQKCARDNW